MPLDKLAQAHHAIERPVLEAFKKGNWWYLPYATYANFYRISLL